jgi:hypothetical protein
MIAIGDTSEKWHCAMRRQAMSYASLIKLLTVPRRIVYNTSAWRKRYEYTLAHGRKPTAAG